MAEEKKVKKVKKANVVIPEMPFEDFCNRVEYYWNNAWKEAQPENYQVYIDLLRSNPTGKSEHEMLYLRTAYDMYLYHWDVFHGARAGVYAKIRSDINIVHMGTVVRVELETVGLRTLKYLYNTFDNLVAEVEDFNVPKLITLTDYEGTPRIDYFRKQEDPMDLAALMLTFGTFVFTEQAWDSLQDITIDEAMNTSIIPNLELRALILSTPFMADQLRDHLTKVDTYVDTRDEENPSVYSLYKSEPGFLDVEDPIYYISCICPSTGRSFMLGCDKHETAKDAIASLLMVPQDLVPHIDKISRQGEIFIVTCDIDVESDEFKKKLKAERVGLKGDLYFSKLVYES